MQPRGLMFKIHEVDEKLAMIAEVKRELARLEQLLAEQRKALAQEARGEGRTYMALISINEAELNAQIKRARELLGREGK